MGMQQNTQWHATFLFVSAGAELSTDSFIHIVFMRFA